ncbi:MAG TPA: hypothetical protein VGR51_07740 [Thermoplasmata archaeon]|nr:hypothetical protein [Thermoplasmata archaeon]
MRLPLRTLALLSVIALAFLAVAPPARADMGKPEWSAGDYWVYAVSGQNFGATGSGTFRMDVIGLDTTNVATIDYQTYRVRLQLNVSGATFNGGDAWFRVSDLALVKQTYNVTFPFFGGSVTIITTVSFNPPLALVWPFATGGNWSATSSVTTVIQVLPFGPGSNVNTLSVDFLVSAPATVAVPAGSFDTTPVRMDIGGYVQTYWAPQAGNYARQEEYNSGSGQVASRELTAYRYAGPGFLGIPLLVWLLILLLIVIVVVAVMLKKRNQPMPPPPQYPPPQP